MKIKVLIFVFLFVFINSPISINNCLAQWVKKSNGLDSAKCINGFVLSGTNLYTCYYGGVFLSANNGDNWTSVNSGLNNSSVLSFAGSGNNLYAGTYGGGIYRSTNGGANWTLSGLAGTRIWSLCMKGSEVLTGRESGGMYRSSDSGATWSYAGLGVGFIFSIAHSNDNIFAGTRSGIYRSTNNGLNWTNVFSIGIDIGVVAINGSYIYAGTSGLAGVYISSNNGETWSAGNSGMSHNMISAFAFAGNNVFTGTDDLGGVYMSTNGGINWFQKNEGFISGMKISRLIIAGNYLFAGGSVLSVWRRPLSDLIVPSAPVLISPLNNSTGNPLNLNLIWSKPQYVTKFRFLLASDSLFANIIHNDSLLTDTVKNLTNLSQLTNYYWKVSAGNTAGWSSYSPAYKFKSIGSPSQVILNLPANNTVNQPVNITFKWYKAFDQTVKTNKAVSNYWLEYSADSSFTNSVVKDTTLTDSLKSVTGLNTSVKYYWRVKAKNIAGWGNFSSIWNFTTVPPVPSAPVLVSPPNNTTNLQPNVLLDWNAVQYAAGYRIQISGDSIFTGIVFDTSSVVQDTLRIRTGILLLNAKYYWRVNASNISGTGTWSSVWNFRINPTALNPIENEIPENFSLAQNYPNPFNPSTKIRFTIPSWEGWQTKSDGVGLVTLKVFDVSGKEIAVLVNEHLQPGTYETDWNASAFSSGVYFYKITAGNFTETKRMILMK